MFGVFLFLLVVLRQVWQSQAQRDKRTDLRARQQKEKRARISHKDASSLQGRQVGGTILNSAGQCLALTETARSGHNKYRKEIAFQSRKAKATSKMTALRNLSSHCDIHMLSNLIIHQDFKKAHGSDFYVARKQLRPKPKSLHVIR